MITFKRTGFPSGKNRIYFFRREVVRLFIQAKLLKVNEICLLIRVNKAQFSLEWDFICQKIQRYKMAKKAFFVFTSVPVCVCHHYTPYRIHCNTKAIVRGHP